MKKIILLTTSLFLSISIFAQEKALQQYGFWDNWFIQAQGGVSYTFSENTEDAAFFKQLAPQAALSFGKFFSPIAGARINLSGWESKNYNYGYFSEDARQMYRVKYFQANLDGILNLTNLFVPYNPDRKFSLNAIFGIGYLHRFDNDKYTYLDENGASRNVIDVHNYLVPRAGLQVDVKMNDAVSLNLEAIGNFLRDDFNGQSGGDEFDIPVSLMAGVTYRFNNRGFALKDVSDPAAIAALNSTINQQRAEIDEKNRLIANYQDELARKPKETIIKEVKEDTETVLNAVVVFKLGSAALQDNQEINIYNAAKYLQDNPKVNVTVTGYADKSTGTAAINQKLSEKRAQAVADILTSKYGIGASRITTKASGDKEQPFQIDAWNRVVIFTAQ